VRSAQRARSYESIEHPAKPIAAMRSRPRWSIMVSGPVADRAARTGHPHAIALDSAIQIAAVLVLLEEGVERVEQRHARESS
jgi:hypothetical protein